MIKKINILGYASVKSGLLGLLAFFIISSCAVFEPELRKKPEGKLPKTFSLYTPGKEQPERWWEEFQEPELNALIEEALIKNLNLKAAWARLKQMRALTGQVEAAQYPDLKFRTGASQALRNAETGNQTVNDYSVGFASSYELDLWGRISAEKSTKILERNAAREDLNTIAITLAAEITKRWISIIAQRTQKHLLKKQLQINTDYLKLLEFRFRKGIVKVLDIYQQRQVIAQLKASLPLVEKQEQLLMHELALLMGKPPQSTINIKRIELPRSPEFPEAGLPADLLANRPDVRASGLRLHAADWQVATARANRLPSISLTAGATYSSSELDTIFDNWILSLSVNLTAPLFEGNRLDAEVDRTQAVVEERLINYRQVVFTAIKEVEDALIREQKQLQHITALKSEIEIVHKVFDESQKRYLKGLNDYLMVITQLLKLQRLEQTLIQRQSELLLYRVDLHRALGGTWTKTIELSL